MNEYPLPLEFSAILIQLKYIPTSTSLSFTLSHRVEKQQGDVKPLVEFSGKFLCNVVPSVD
jgi:hypothetical protein